MTAEKIIAELKSGKFKPVYWLEGEEDYFIDKVMQYAEHHILPESEAGFNLTVFYGKDADWAAVVNACRRYPMFAERQVVLLKEAQQMRDVEKLEGYIEKPLLSTVFLVSYKGKKIDGRTRLAKLLKEKGVVLTTKKLYENEMPEWTQALIKSKGLSITGKALLLLIDHIGNDLSRLNNEIDKLALNLGSRKQITEDDIETFVGVSKEFNIFELQHAIASKDLYKAMRIIHYFEANPKAAPIQQVLPTLYNFFSKVLMVFSVPSRDEKTIAQAIGVNQYFARDYAQTALRFKAHQIEKVLLLLHQYNLKSVGVDDAGNSDASLMKEMVAKMITD